MPEFAAPIVAKILAVIEARTPGLLAAASREPFAELGKQFSRVLTNAPACWVMPVRSEFDPEMTGFCHQVHQVRITIAVAGTEQAELTSAAMAYVKAVDDALAASWPMDWSGEGNPLANGQVMNVFVRSHDYGPLFDTARGIARFPELDVVVETQEAL